jgi:predicted nucleic acid-binding protein
MNQRVFLDTNVLIYATAGRLSDPEEFGVARTIVNSANFYVSPLILGEFYSIVRKPQHEMMENDDALGWIDDWLPFCPIDIDGSIIFDACRYRERYKMQLWDAAHIATAERLGSNILFSEDMSHGQTYGSVTVINPFRAQH